MMVGLSFIAVALLVLALVLAITRRSSTTQRGMIDLTDPPVLLTHWVMAAAMAVDHKHLHQHILKHAGELTSEIEGNGTFETWSASMHNLLAIYDAAHGVQPSTVLRLERMTAKYLSAPTLYVEPPAPLPARIVEGAKGPLIEVRRKQISRA